MRERKEAEVALRYSENRYRSVIEAMPDAMVVYDMEGRVIFMNPAFTDVFGWTSDECMGKRMDHFVPRENWEETRKGLKTITSGKPLSCVITSYSIHYTKLYEAAGPQQGDHLHHPHYRCRAASPRDRFAA